MMTDNVNVYKANRRDFEFLMWEQFNIETNLLKLRTYKQYSKKYLMDLFDKAISFAYTKMGPLYQYADQIGCKWIDETNVSIPPEFYKIWPEFKSNWSNLLTNSGIPHFVKRMITEMFMGANPSFMTYNGFAAPSAELIESFGTENQKKLFIKQLKDNNWSSCFCLTEKQAGSDISAVETTAIKIKDDLYHIKGQKLFISAGMHSLTENILYFVVAKTKPSESTYALSCFIVPKYHIHPEGMLGKPNGVRCTKLVNKMGFKGCVNATLEFGDKDDCFGYLLGGRENIALSQIIHIMHEARLSTGLFALGMASSAYLNSEVYAYDRTQGRRYGESFHSNTSRVKIVEHADVKRMLLEMKCKVEGCRALMAMLSYHESLIKHYKTHPDINDKHKLTHSVLFVNLLNPLVKAHFSEEAWRVSELAIQVLGGNGYTSDYPLEQYARDIKILSIWEGTNYIQAQSLMREKLNSGKNKELIDLYFIEMTNLVCSVSDNHKLHDEIIAVNDSLNNLKLILDVFKSWVKKNEIDSISGYSTLFLKIMSECTISVLQLQAAHICLKALENTMLDTNEIKFYNRKLMSSRYYIWNFLPNHLVYLTLLQKNLTDFSNSFF